jgi:hypothetical protein
LEQKNSLAVIQEVDQLLPNVETLKQMRTVADYMVNAKMLPPGYTDGNDLMVIALRGREMGVPLGQAIQGMFPMKGRIGYMGGFLLSRVRQILPESYIRVKENTKTKCVLECKRDRNHEPELVEFTMEEAIACNYHQNWDSGTKSWKPKQTWKDSANMLYWRCVSRAINRVFSDVFGAPVYQFDELVDTEAIDVTPQEQAARGVPYATAASEPVPAAKIEDAEIVPPAQEVPPPDQPPSNPPEQSSVPTEEKKEGKMNQAMIDLLVKQFEDGLAACKTKKEVELLFEDFKKTGVGGKVLTSAFHSVRAKKETFHAN